MIEKLIIFCQSAFFLPFLIYWSLISVIAIFVTILDKKRAIHNGWRIQEKSLMLCALLGGALTMLITMRIIRHKTRHKKFMFGLPVVIILHILLFVTLFCIF